MQMNSFLWGLVVYLLSTLFVFTAGLLLGHHITLDRFQDDEANGMSLRDAIRHERFERGKSK